MASELNVKSVKCSYKTFYVRPTQLKMAQGPLSKLPKA